MTQRTHPVPRATYRLQFNRDFTFAQAAEILDYLEQLGISDVYASPLFKTSETSSHGYDVCGFDQINPRLGGEAGFVRLSGAIRKRGMGLLLDIVPNHMGADLCNDLWRDLLENGRGSQYAGWFDIDWTPADGKVEDKILIPTLEDYYAQVLEAGKLKIVYEEGGFAVAYYERKFPLCPESYGLLMDELSKQSFGPELQLAIRTLELALRQIGNEAAEPALRRDLFASARDHLGTLVHNSQEFKTALDRTLLKVNGDPGIPESFDLLNAILRKQHYRLAYWRVGPEEINYRRFFDVITLISLKMGKEEVFQQTHRLVTRFLAEGRITGVRVDHPDGLWDPKRYFQRLQGAGPQGQAGQSNYVVVEKILTGDELLPLDWPVAGTTGYDFLNRLNGVFVDHRNAEVIDNIYRGFTGIDLRFQETFIASKKRILERSLISELKSLAHKAREVARHTRYGYDFTFAQLHETLGELIAAFPVYRTYVGEQTGELSSSDALVLDQAFATAKAQNPKVDNVVFDFLAKLLFLKWPADLDLLGQKLAREFVMKFQQLTGPVMAKGLEDTAFYNFNRLISLNEVGGAPEVFGYLPEQFHIYNIAKAANWPHGLNATSTHDTKRGEDVRARINVLSEMPEEWRAALAEWRRLNGDLKKIVDGEPAPHPNEEFLLYQTLLGAWETRWREPEWRAQFRARMVEYMMKAIKEAKARTGWKNPNPEYEAATRFFVEELLRDGENPFVEEFERFQVKVSFFGQFNSLSQLLLKLVSPGVPDFYQGTEFWDFTLVDPDNRRPVNYQARRELLRELQNLPEGRVPSLDGPSAASKLFVTWRGLQLRRNLPELFAHGRYIPLLCGGTAENHVCALARLHDDQCVIAIAPRLVYVMTGGKPCSPVGEIWQDTVLRLPESVPEGHYRDIFTGNRHQISPGQSLRIAEALGHFPVCLLTH